MPNIFFTADSHFSHTNIIRYVNRPFASVEEHDETLIANCNSKVSKGDSVYHLGDFALCSNGYCENILKQLNGQKFLILGNHDKTAQNPTCRKYFAWQKDYYRLKIDCATIILSHYAHRTWHGAHRGNWHLFGHSHGKMPPLGKSFDVGVDCWNYFPVSFDEVKQKMDSLSWAPPEDFKPALPIHECKYCGTSYADELSYYEHMQYCA